MFCNDCFYNNKVILLQFKDYLVNKDYDVTFICNTDESMYELCNEQVHYIPVPMKRSGTGWIIGN